MMTEKNTSLSLSANGPLAEHIERLRHAAPCWLTKLQNEYTILHSQNADTHDSSRQLTIQSVIRYSHFYCYPITILDSG